MFLAEPPLTAYDLRFRIAGIPARVHPTFWLMCLVFGGRDAAALLTGTVAVFLSLLIHELGHALVMGLFGESARIVLYMMGGLAISEGRAWGYQPGRTRRGPFEQILISAAGPGAGFLLAGLVSGLLLVAGGSLEVAWLGGVVPLPLAYLPARLADNLTLLHFIDQLLWFNVFWGLINLAPVFPLDGGKIARELLVSADSWNGATRAVWLSVGAAVVVALGGWYLLDDWYLPLFFGMLAVLNYQALRGDRGGRSW